MDGNIMARDYLVKVITGLNDGMVPTLHDFSYNRERNGEATTISGTNIIANIPGKMEGGPVLKITAHYDHLGTHDGTQTSDRDSGEDCRSGCSLRL